MSVVGSSGESSVEFEEPDTFVWTLVGSLTAEVVRELSEVQERRAKGLPHVFVMIDVADVGPVSEAARKESVRDRDVNVRGTAFVGASFHIRVLATLVTKAANVLNRPQAVPVRFFKTKAEAFAWFTELRSAIARGAGP